MPIATRQNPTTGQLEIQHPDLQIWTSAVALLQVAGGFSTKLVQEQADLLNAIALKIIQLDSIANNGADVKTNIAAIKTLLETIQQKVDANSTSVDTTSTKVGLLYDLVQTLVTATNSSTAASTNTLQGVTLVRGQLDDVKTLLAPIPQTRDAIKDGQATDIFIRTVDIPVANTEYSCALPDKTKGLSFFARKNSFGKSPGDLRYAFTTGNVANPAIGNYQTIYRYGIFSQLNLLWSGKTIYFASSNPMVVEVQVIY